MLIGVDFPLKGVVSCTKRLKCLNSGECVGSSYRIWMSNRDITDNFFVRIKVEQRDDDDDVSISITRSTAA